MKQKQKKKLQEKQIMHQHRGEDGQICGRLHPLNSIHTKESTIKAHQRTVLINLKLGE